MQTIFLDISLQSLHCPRCKETYEQPKQYRLIFFVLNKYDYIAFKGEVKNIQTNIYIPWEHSNNHNIQNMKKIIKEIQTILKIGPTISTQVSYNS